MAKAQKEIKVTRLSLSKGTCQGLRNLKTSSMNKSKKRSYKKYKGQGKP